jgi:hypothetical protein
MNIIKFFNCFEFNDNLFFNKYIDNIFTYDFFLIKNLYVFRGFASSCNNIGGVASSFQ